MIGFEAAISRPERVEQAVHYGVQKGNLFLFPLGVTSAFPIKPKPNNKSQ